MGPFFILKELKASSKTQEAQDIMDAIPHGAYIIALDERGENLDSRTFATLFEKAATTHGHVALIIGGADGLDPHIRTKASKIISFGKLTWPHMLARVMAVEQIYRAYSILSNHPYHRD